MKSGTLYPDDCYLFSYQKGLKTITNDHQIYVMVVLRNLDAHIIKYGRTAHKVMFIQV
jgi:hypothetical protein